MEPRRRPASTSHSPSRSTSYRTTYGTGAGVDTGSSTSNPFYPTNDSTIESRPRTGGRSVAWPGTARPGTAVTSRPRTGYSTLGVEKQEIICAVSESRGISPSVGLAFINLDTGEAVLSQLNDSQTYVRTTHKLMVFGPSDVLMVHGAAEPKSKLFSIIEDNLDNLDSKITLIDRKHFAENTGLEYIQQFAFRQDVESIRTAVTGNYYAVCCFAAALKYIELGLGKTFLQHSLRIKYEPSEGSMMIDLATIQSLELVQNIQHSRSRDCLFGLLNETLTPMGGRLLRSNILQPTTDPDTLRKRYDAVEELSTKEDMFFAVRQALKPSLDADKILTRLILVPIQVTLYDVEQAVNNVIMLKQFIAHVQPVFEALSSSRCEMLRTIRGICASGNTDPVQTLIDDVVNEDTTYAAQPLDLRNQRTYAVKSGVNGLLDVARQTYKEAMMDALQHIGDLAEEHKLPLQTKFDNRRQFFIRLHINELEGRDLPGVFINNIRRKDVIECQTLELVKRNQKISDAHSEVLLMSDKSVRSLIADVREYMFGLFKICESLAVLDMLTSFAHLVASRDYSRPTFSESGTLAVRSGRHPVREKIFKTEFIPNDVYATQQTRFQIITGCNMSGKSTYIRSVALMTIMAQVGSFVPAQNAAFPIVRQLFARVSMNDSIEANVSTFAAEMRETAFILRNIDRSSIAIIDELGRGTSTRDGLAIALAIAEALVESRAFVWFATHFRDLSHILAERNGVVSLHLTVDMSEENKIEMLYRIAAGTVQEQHYGLRLAKVLPFPPDVIGHAELVSRELEQQTQQKKQNSLGIIHARRRKLLLNLKEHLVQAKEGNMDDGNMKEWLRELQREFVTRMSALDEEMKRIGAAVANETVSEIRTVSTVRRPGKSRDGRSPTSAYTVGGTDATGFDEPAE